MREGLYREGAKQGTQTPSPAPRLIPAETENQPRTNIETGTANRTTQTHQAAPRSTVQQNQRITRKGKAPQRTMRRIPKRTDTGTDTWAGATFSLPPALDHCLPEVLS